MAAIQQHSFAVRSFVAIYACSWGAMRYLSRLIFSICLGITQDIIYQPVDWDK